MTAVSQWEREAIGERGDGRLRGREILGDADLRVPMIAIGREIKWALNDSELARHLSDGRLSGIYGTIVYTDLGNDADGNVHVGLAYLNHLLQAFNGNEQLALSAWYQGERATRAAGPYKVTKVFVADVLALRQRM